MASAEEARTIEPVRFFGDGLIREEDSTMKDFGPHVVRINPTDTEATAPQQRNEPNARGFDPEHGIWVDPAPEDLIAIEREATEPLLPAETPVPPTDPSEMGKATGAPAKS